MCKTIIFLIVILNIASFCYTQEAIIPSDLVVQNLTEQVTPTSEIVKLNYSQSYTKGRYDATTMHSSSGYFLGGVGAGLVLGLIGTAIIGFSAGGSQPDIIPENVDPNGYQAGYFKEAKSKNQESAWGGGLLGTVIVVAAVLALN